MMNELSYVMSPVAFHVAGRCALDALGAAVSGRSRRATRSVLFVLAHGAGAGQSHPFMVRYARGLAERGIDVVTFNFPYMEAGRRAPDRAPVLEDAFRRVVVSAAAHRHVQATARCSSAASRWADAWPRTWPPRPTLWPAGAPALAGVVVFGYPLKPPGGSQAVARSRVASLRASRCRSLIVQGTRDTFGGPDGHHAQLRRRRQAADSMRAVDGGDHSLAVRKSTGRARRTSTAICSIRWRSGSEYGRSDY